MPKQPLEGEVVQIVWECWVKGDANTFMKLDSLEEVQAWFLEQLPQLKKHEVLNVVPHSEDEYVHGSGSPA